MLDKLIGLPVQAKLIIAAALAAAMFFAGFSTERVLKNGEIAKIELAHAKVVGAAKDARIAADAHTEEVQRTASAMIAAAESNFTEISNHDKAAADRTIADLLTANKRLRVSTTRDPGRGAVAETTAGAGGGDGEAVQTLSPTVAGRLARRYADYNALIDQLDLCQAVVVNDRLMLER